ncbi:MAG TPA: hypothetical protein VFA45_13365 [Actinomycetes bacterium]|jgi:hypothetical protein|nr:hypothetical protein [Actinomycetes bacterium]
MRLIISRRQNDIKGMLGGHKGVQFSITFRLELTPEEAELVRRYNLGSYPVTRSTATLSGTLDSYLRGQSQTVSDVTTLISNERIIKEACDELPVLFAVCRSFGGDEIIEYPRETSAESVGV